MTSDLNIIKLLLFNEDNVRSECDQHGQLLKMFLKNERPAT
jgi:hypothetical protein